MDLFSFVAAAYTSLAVAYVDRAPELVPAKTVQSFDVVVGVTEGSEWQRKRWPGDVKELAAASLALGHHESAFSLDISNGICKPYQCDMLRGVPQSISNWQFKASPKGATQLYIWELARTNVNIAAREAARLLTNARLRCASLELAGFDWPTMVFAAYSGRGCRGTFRGIQARVATVRRLMGVRPQKES